VSKIERTWKIRHGTFWLTVIKENNNPPKISFHTDNLDRYNLTPQQLKQLIQNLHEQLDSIHKDFFTIQLEIEKTL